MQTKSHNLAGIIRTSTVTVLVFVTRARQKNGSGDEHDLSSTAPPVRPSSRDPRKSTGQLKTRPQRGCRPHQLPHGIPTQAKEPGEEKRQSPSLRPRTLLSARPLSIAPSPCARPRPTSGDPLPTTGAQHSPRVRRQEVLPTC